MPTRKKGLRRRPDLFRFLDLKLLDQGALTHYDSTLRTNAILPIGLQYFWSWPVPPCLGHCRLLAACPSFLTTQYTHLLAARSAMAESF
jgi:hypothetical protein